MNSIYIPDFDPHDFVPRGIVNLIEGKGLPSAADVPRRVCLIGMTSNDDGDPVPWNRRSG